MDWLSFEPFAGPLTMVDCPICRTKHGSAPACCAVLVSMSVSSSPNLHDFLARFNATVLKKQRAAEAQYHWERQCAEEEEQRRLFPPPPPPKRARRYFYTGEPAARPSMHRPEACLALPEGMRYQVVDAAVDDFDDAWWGSVLPDVAYREHIDRRILMQGERRSASARLASARRREARERKIA